MPIHAHFCCKILQCGIFVKCIDTGLLDNFDFWHFPRGDLRNQTPCKWTGHLRASLINKPQSHNSDSESHFVARLLAHHSDRRIKQFFKARYFYTLVRSPNTTPWLIQRHTSISHIWLKIASIKDDKCLTFDFWLIGNEMRQTPIFNNTTLKIHLRFEFRGW